MRVAAAQSLLLASVTLAFVHPAHVEIYASEEAKVRSQCNYPNVEVARSPAPGVQVEVTLAPSSGIGLYSLAVHLSSPRRVRLVESRLRVTSAELAAPIDVAIGPLLGIRAGVSDGIRVEPGGEMTVAADYFAQLTHAQVTALGDVQPSRIAIELPALVVDGETRALAPVDLELREYWTMVGVCQ